MVVARQPVTRRRRAAAPTVANSRHCMAERLDVLVAKGRRAGVLVPGRPRGRVGLCRAGPALGPGPGPSAVAGLRGPGRGVTWSRRRADGRLAPGPGTP